MLNYLDNNVILNSKTGIITFNNLKIGEYFIPVTYSLNNTFVELDYNITVKPIFYYPTNNQIRSGIPYTFPKGGVFKIDNNDVTIDNNGQIDFTNYNYIGEYNFNISYTINNITTDTIYTIRLLPTLNINDNYSFFYGDLIIIDLIISNNSTIHLSNSNFTYVNNQIINQTVIDVGYHELILEYIVNNIKLNKTILVTIYPKLLYSINQLIINNNNNKSEIPMISPIGGTFNLSNNLNSNLIIDDNGQLICSRDNISANNYSVIVDYIVNNIKSTILYNIVIEPYFYYQPNTLQIVYGFTDNTDKPIININNGTYSLVSLSNIKIDSKTGIISFNKNINVGTYSLTINYTINDHIINTDYTLTVIPSFVYSPYIYKILYSKYFETDKPTIYGLNNDNNSYSYSINPNIKGMEIDSKTGIIKFNKNDIIEVNDYNIIINLNYGSNTINTNINLTILPELIYDSYISNINYNQNLITSMPYINPIGGQFMLVNNLSDSIFIDSLGTITTNNLDLGNYNFKVQYNINNVVNEIDYNINCNPTILYENNLLEVVYTNLGESVIPIVSPVGGTFKIKDNAIGIKINNNGQIMCNNNLVVGKYNITVLYQVNRNYVSTLFTIIVQPTISYEPSIFIYNSFLNGNKPFISYPGGLFKIPGSPFEINENTGVLSLYNVEPNNYNIPINYTINNVTVSTIYNILIKPSIKYEYEPIMKLGTIINLKPIVEPENGQFNSDICDNLEIGNYNFNVSYTYNNIKSDYSINFVIETNIYYEVIDIYYDEKVIIYPKNYNGYGEFSSLDVPVNNKGEILISNLELGSYAYNIYYVYNNIKTLIELKFNIIPKFNYQISNIIINYGNLANSIKPFVNYSDSTSIFYFPTEYDFIEIDASTGIINFDNNLKIGKYLLEINYSVKNIIVKTTFNVEVIPTFFYNNSLISIKYNQDIIIDKPIIQPNYGYFICFDLSENLILNKDGSIKFHNKLDVGEYILKINYVINDNINSSSYININVNPEIEYSNNIIKNVYGTYYESELPIINSDSNGLFKLNNKINGININSQTGKIIFDSLLDVQTYNLVIGYELNNIYTTTKFTYIVLPKIESLNNTFIFEYNSNAVIDPPIVKPEGGKFNNEQILINELMVGKHNLTLDYTYNEITNSINYEITITPTINYPVLDKMIIYNSSQLSDMPIIKPSGGVIKGDNINHLGQVIFNHYNVGFHEVTIEYELNNQTNSTNYKFEIIPDFYYKNKTYTMDYKTVSYSDKPIVNPKGLNFYSDDIKNISSEGIIEFSNYEVGNYKLIINYEKSIDVINLQVKPIFNYKESNIIINYGDSKIIYPVIVNKGGIFWSNDDNIIPNKVNGLIQLENIMVCNKSVTIYYELNNVVSSQIINIICNPIFYYKINKTIINYNSYCHSIIPDIKPLINQNLVTCKNLPDNVIIDNNGIINFINPNVGNYNLELEYMYIKTNYNLIVNPIFYYDQSDVFYYGFTNYSSKPILNPKGGNFICKENINDDGIITINNNIGEYNINIIYSLNNQLINANYSYKIKPFIFYKNMVVSYGYNQPVIPIVYIQSGIFTINDNKLSIDNQGIINNINLLEPNKYLLIITYTYNDISYDTKFNLIVKPNISYVDNQLLLEPNNGILKYDKNMFIIKDNQINLLSYKIGKYNFNIDYIYNNIKSTINLDLFLTTTALYDLSSITLYYDEAMKIKPMVNHGLFKTNNLYSDILLSSDGSINIKNCNVGKYILLIEYENNNYTLTTEFTIIVKPRISYDTEPIIYGQYKLPVLNLYPRNGIISFKNSYKNIKYNSDGTIIFNNAYPSNYIFNVDYTYNNIVESINFTINVKPYIFLDLENIVMKYNSNFIINNLVTLPYGGNIISDLPETSVTNNIISINKNKMIGHYNLNIEYSLNNQSSVLNKKLIIEPEFYYNINRIELNYYDTAYSMKPYTNPSGGQFICTYDNNIGTININSDTGLITFSKINIGNYKIIVKYLLNDFIIDTEYNIISKPVFYYNNLLTLQYQESYEIITNEPIYYPIGGVFNVNNNIKINNNGQLTFTNLSVDSYEFNINYIVNNHKMNTIYKLVVKPTINYPMSVINIEYNTSYQSERPVVNPLGGKFTLLNYLSGVDINPNNGNIIIYQLNEAIIKNKKYNKSVLDKGSYTITISYIFNNQTSLNNIFLNII